MPLTPCEPSTWYLVIACKRCGVRQPIHRDQSGGKATLLRNYTWQCVECGHVDTYEPYEVERYQHGVRQ